MELIHKMENRSIGAADVIASNLRMTAIDAVEAMERRLAHIKEQADMIVHGLRRELDCENVLQAVLTMEDAGRIYRESMTANANSHFFGEVNRHEEPAFFESLSRLDALYRCKCIAATSPCPKIATLHSFLFSASVTKPEAEDQKVAFLRNVQASRAFECFAKYLGGVSAVYENNFQSACESVYSGNATYAVLPIYNTADGRLNGFYHLLEKYDLNIVMSCSVESEDGENATTFALVYKDRLYMRTSGVPLYECRITVSDLSELSDLLFAAQYYGVKTLSLDAIPRMFSGRENTFGLIFCLSEEADMAGFFCYLTLEYPQVASFGIYDRMERGVV